MSKKVRHSQESIVFNVIATVFFSVVAISVIYPFWQVLVTSFVGEGEFYRRVILLWPEKIVLKNYEEVLQYTNVARAFINSVVVTCIGAFYSLSITLSMAYAMSKRTLPGHKGIMSFVVAAMFFSGGTIPYYLLMKSLGLMGNPLVLILPFAINLFYMIMSKAFFEQFPGELEESARIDGAGDIRIFTSIVLPNSGPLIATIFFYYTVMYWNSWFGNLLFLSDTKEWQTLQYVLRKIVLEASRPDQFLTSNNIAGTASFEMGVNSATIMIATLPILLIFPLMRKYFEQGTFIGSVKG